MRIINVLLLVSLCYLVSAKYLPEETASTALLRNVRSTRNELLNTQESQSNESNEHDDNDNEEDNDDDNADDDDDSKNDSLEKRRLEQIEKLERKRVEEQRKLQEKREKEDRKRKERLEKEQEKRKRIEAKFEEEKRKLEEKLEKEKRERREKIEKEQRKRAEKLAKEEQKRKEKIAKDERKQQQQISKQATTISSPIKTITSAESEEDLDLEDIWKNYIYDKYGLSLNSTDIEKNGAVNRYVQEELGLNANSTKAEYHQAVLQLVQNRLADQQTTSDTKSNFQNYLASHVNAIYLQKLQVEIESKIAELENDTVLLQNVSLPWVPQARHTIQQKKTILTSIAQYISNILPNWITGSNSSLPANPSSLNSEVTGVSDPNSIDAGFVQGSNDTNSSGGVSENPTLNGTPSNTGGISSNGFESSDNAGNTNLLDYNNTGSIDAVASLNNPASINNNQAVSSTATSNNQWNEVSLSENDLSTLNSISGVELTGSVTEGTLTNDGISTNNPASGFDSGNTGLTKPSIVIDGTTIESVAFNEVSETLSNNGGTSSNGVESSVHAGNTNPLDYNDTGSIDTVASSNNSSSISNNHAASSTVSATIQENDSSLGGNNLSTSNSISGIELEGSVTEETLANGAISTSNTESVAFSDVITADPSPVISMKPGISSNSTSSSVQSASSNNVTTGTEASINSVTSGTDVNLIVPMTTISTNLEGLDNPNLIINNAHVSVSSTPATSPEIIDGSTSEVSVNMSTNNIEVSNTASPTNLQPIVASIGTETITQPGIESISTDVLAVPENTNIASETDATNPNSNSTQISDSGIIEQSVSESSNTATAETIIAPEAVVSSSDSTLGGEITVAGSTDSSTNISELPTLSDAIISNSVNTATEEISNNITPNDVGAISVVETSINTSSGGETSPTVTEVAIESTTMAISSDTVAVLNNDGTITQETGTLDVNFTVTEVVTDNKGDVSPPITEDLVSTTDVGPTIPEGSNTSSVADNIITTEYLPNITSSGTEIPTSNSIDITSTANEVAIENTANIAPSSPVENSATNTYDSGPTIADTIVAEGLSTSTITLIENTVDTAATDFGSSLASSSDNLAGSNNITLIDVAATATTESGLETTLSGSIDSINTQETITLAAEEIIQHASNTSQSNTSLNNTVTVTTTEQVADNTIDAASITSDTTSATTDNISNAEIVPEVATTVESNVPIPQITAAPVEANLEGTGESSVNDMTITSDINTNTPVPVVATTGGLDSTAIPTSNIPNIINEATAIQSGSNGAAAVGTDNPKNLIEQNSITSTPQTIVTEVVPLSPETVVDISVATEKVIVASLDAELQSTDVDASATNLANTVDSVTTETVGITEASLAGQDNNYTPTIPEEAGASLLEVTQQ